MLIFDDSKGTSDGKERDQLQAMIAVGSEFITYTDAESTVQKSGEFARIEKNSSDPAPRFCLLHETSEAHTEDGRALTGNELRTVAPNVKMRKRSRIYVSEQDPETGDLPFFQLGGFKASSRIPRYQSLAIDHPRNFSGAYEANYTAMSGKRRLFPTGDGGLLLLKEIHYPSDPRWFADQMSEQDPTYGFTRNRGLRAARVELVEISPVSGVEGKSVFGFDVHSGLLGYPGKRFASPSVRTTSEMFEPTDGGRVFAAFAGVNFGSSLDAPAVGGLPAGGDASDTYAVSEPSVAKVDGKDHHALFAVYQAADDVYNQNSSGAYRLTCKYLLADGTPAFTKINFPPIPGSNGTKHYLAARGMSLHRVSPTRVALRVNVHVMQYGAGGALQASAGDSFFTWTNDNGATWTYVQATFGWFGVGPYGGVLARDKDSLLAFSWYPFNGSVTASNVHKVTPSGTALVSSIPGSLFNAGLMTPYSGDSYSVNYFPVGFGGAVDRIVNKKRKRRLWMQFDPSWVYDAANPRNIMYPGARPQLAVSDDNGVTWQRRFLPTPWPFLAGFVVSIDEKTLAMPVSAARKEFGTPLKTTIYVSKDGGDTWKASGAKATLPGESWSDGQIVIGAPYLDNRDVTRFEQDLVDTCTSFNRGELHPLISLRDASGKLLPANPARPWMNDYRFKEPDYG